MAKLTPMMEQYMKIKADYKDAFLFYRLGDFYEMFFDDAIRAAQELEITLTKRGGQKENPIPMCGVPYHSSASYIKTLIERGYKVAVCEQVEDPKTAKGVVKREVVQLITPGTVMEDGMLKETESNRIASLSYFAEDDLFILTYSELSTGESQLVAIDQGWDAVLHELYNQPIREVVVAADFNETYKEILKNQLKFTLSYQDDTVIEDKYSYLTERLENAQEIQAYGRLLNYLIYTQKRSLDHLQQPEIIPLQEHLALDMYSKRNLELTETIIKKEKHGSLLWVLDKTATAMGSRMLKKWLERPLLHKQKIEERLEVVEGFHSHFMEREAVREILKSVYDLERLAGRVSFGNVNARDLLQLKQSLKRIPELKNTLEQFDVGAIRQLGKELEYPEAVVELLENSITEEPAISVTEGGIIKQGYNQQLDTYRDASSNGKQWIASLEKKEKEQTGIKSLKIGYNRVFGYYIEITRTNLHLLDDERYERKQTLANAERFITPELKEKEKLILEADEKSIDLEYKLFLEVREEMKAAIPVLQRIAETVSRIDVLQGFAEVSEANNYHKPSFGGTELHIKDGRHPVIEQVMKNGEFVPNDISLTDDASMLLITGPNMSGKSTYMRQLALTAIMGQIGCFVPAKEADLMIFDQIFTRIGAADDLVSGQSTFMVEMLEAKHAITNATERSLILLDEIGRGTSTYDGMALAQAIMEYIHDNVKAKTLFSTHYHELTELKEFLPHLKNIHVRAEEHDGKVVFLHQIHDGAADKSYGIHVAELAELPEQLIERAAVILKELETPDTDKTDREVLHESNQLSFFGEEEKQEKHHAEGGDVLVQLKNMDLFDMTPMDAMNELYKLQKQLKK